MTSPNYLLGIWLFNLIDPEPENRMERFLRRNPYSCSDLIAIGFDSVIVERCDDRYIMHTAEIGAFESWAYS